MIHTGMKNLFISVLTCICVQQSQAQYTPYFLKGTLKENRQQLHRNIVNNIITKNLSLPLTDSTEEKWEAAFEAIEQINYSSAWVDAKVHQVSTELTAHSNTFQCAFLQLVYARYPGLFQQTVSTLLQHTNEQQVMVMAALNLLKSPANEAGKKLAAAKTKEALVSDPNNPVLIELLYNIQHPEILFPTETLRDLFNKNYLAGNTIVFSLQRKNRDYPGIVLVRDTAGNFVRINNQLFAVPQLAKSATTLPGYLRNGNTPEGIFRMDGFDTSASNFIGPTTNIQLTLPFEYSARHFFRDSSLTDTSWNIDLYKKQLPASLQNYFPLYETWYAGKSGRNEIIAHGTTIDPSYYKNKPYYPLTPTLGCLCTKEIWNDETGRLAESDQQLLVNALLKAGGPNGYLLVINLDDQQKPVDISEIINFLPPPNHN